MSPTPGSQIGHAGAPRHLVGKRGFAQHLRYRALSDTMSDRAKSDVIAFSPPISAVFDELVCLEVWDAEKLSPC